MKNRYWLFRRGHVFYLEDAHTRRKESLHTADPHEARRLRDARNQAAESPALSFALARAYLIARDPAVARRTWQEVIEQFCSRGKPQTQAHRRRVSQSKPFALIRQRKLLETTAEDFLAVLAAGGVMTSAYLRCLQNLAQGLGWLPWPVLPPKLWPAAPIKPKRGITAEEHLRITASEKNSERRIYYEVLWETGAAQSDAAALRAENIDWGKNLLSYQRQKTGEQAFLKIGDRLAQLLRELPATGALFPKLSTTSNNDRAAEFYRRCRLLDIKGITLHSYRYAWAERAKSCGYPERYAMQALGHSSAAVHRVYSRSAQVEVPSLQEYENKIIPLPTVSPKSACDRPGNIS